MILSAFLCGMLLAVGPPGPAQKTYQEAKALAKRDPEAHVRLAAWCAEQGMEPERQKHLGIAVLLDPNHAAARKLLGFSWNGKSWQKLEVLPEEPEASDDPATLRARYQSKRVRLPHTADGHWQLVLWCERNGLTQEALHHAAIVVRLDPSREMAWKRLGYKRFQVYWMTDPQIAAAKAEIEAQAKADRKWLPLLTTWKTRLSDPDKARDAQRLLAGVTDPRAVPSVWRVFGTGSASDQAVAMQVLGQIDSTYSSRALAVLTVFGKTSGIRRGSTETLARRDPRQYADLLIGLLRDPLAYRYQAVAGPGVPGSLVVKGPQAYFERIYTSVPPPNLPIFPGERITFDFEGLPIIVRHTDETVLPFAWLDKFNYTYLYRGLIPPHISNTISLGRMWAENARSARVAQQQLQSDVAALDWHNELLLAANTQVVSVLSQVTRQDLPVDRAAWRTWWFDELGISATPNSEPLRPVFTEVVPPAYLPRDVGGLGFDPDIGYYLRVPVPPGF